MVARNKGLASQQTLVWNAENRLSEVQDSNGDMLESYWYDVDGGRVKKTSGNTTTYTFFGHYEEEVTHGATTAVSHYSFGSLRVAVKVKRGGILFHLHGDHLGSTSLTTRGSSTIASRAYYAYGAKRVVSGDLRTDRTFTGQKRDATGLMYYNARYYDPALGTFISPDSLVPNPARVIDYNRFLYARGNPLKYTDPTGHNALGPEWVAAFKAAHGGRAPNAQDRRDRLASLATRGGVSGRRSWTDADWRHYANNKRSVLTRVVAKAGIKIDSSWNSDPNKTARLELLAEGVLKLGEKIGDLRGGSVDEGLGHLKDLIGGGVTLTRASKGTGFCAGGDACAVEDGQIGFYDGLFDATKFPDDGTRTTNSQNFIRGTAVHELAHKIHIHRVCPNNPSAYCLIYDIGENIDFRVHSVTGYSTFYWEHWAEIVTDWTYGSDYQQRPRYNRIREPVNANQIQAIEEILGK